MSHPGHEMAEIIGLFGNRFIDKHHPNTYQLRVLNALSMCRTPALGGHKYRCDHCGREHTAYNSCRNRHCPKCQGAKQAFWVENRIDNAYPAKHYHIVFTVPEALNPICMTDSRWFYNHLFESVWNTLRSFGYTHFGVESGAVCLLHTWGQNLSLHPHIHCIIPALGYDLKGQMKPVGGNGKYLYPVKQLSAKFRGRFMSGVKEQLSKTGALCLYRVNVDKAWSNDWVVHCKPSFSNPKAVIGYLGQYTHRVAITNDRILKVTDQKVCFRMKDYRNHGLETTTTLCGEEFLRRFCLHILPGGFVKIRHYGIYSTRFMTTVLKDKDKMVIKPPETTAARITRLMGFDPYQCPKCRKGRLLVIAVIPRIRSPAFCKVGFSAV